jgi:hypothetical protein
LREVPAAERLDRVRALSALRREIPTVRSNPACGAPKLRMRVASVTVHQDKESNGDEIYCVITAEGKDAEVKVTKITPELSENKQYNYSLSEGIFWGQKELKETATNLHIRYECIENDDPGAWSKLVQDLAAELTKRGADAAASSLGGWVVPIVEGLAGRVPLLREGDAVELDAHAVRGGAVDVMASPFGPFLPSWLFDRDAQQSVKGDRSLHVADDDVHLLQRERHGRDVIREGSEPAVRSRTLPA